jgi:hypothetical protein
MRPIGRIIVHHSAGRSDETVAAIRRFHTAKPPAGRGWSDIGYHYIVRLDGDRWQVEPGRAVERVGSHDEGQNADSIGVCLLGDYTGGYPVPPLAWAALVELVSDLMRVHHLTADQVEGHRENEPAHSPTMCPGFDPTLLRAALQPR